jgi:hypothetical protein
MFATSKIPEDIIGVILRGAELPIDTRLVMREYLEPRRVVVPDGLAEKLAEVHGRRTKGYTKYVQMCKNSPFLWCVALDRSDAIKITENKFVEFYVSEVEMDESDEIHDDDATGERIIEFHQKITTFASETERADPSMFPLFSINDLRCDISTGRPFPITFAGNTMYHLMNRPQ